MYNYNSMVTLHRQTWRGLRNTLILEENATEIAGIRKAKDAPITTGSLVPSHVCNRVLIPATKSSVWIISAFSTYSFPSKHNKIKNWVSNPNKMKKKLKKKVDYYIATTHQRNKNSGNNDNGSKHNNVMLKPKKNPFSCKCNKNMKNKPKLKTLWETKNGYYMKTKLQQNGLLTPWRWAPNTAINSKLFLDRMRLKMINFSTTTTTTFTSCHCFSFALFFCDNVF
jgi:hypothetical protein